MKLEVKFSTRTFSLQSTPQTDAGRPVWVLETPIEWEFWYDNNLIVRDTIPVGFKTDLGSIPRFLSSIISGDDPWNLAYICHDRWCVEKWLNSDLASLFLRAAAKELGCPSWKATAIYTAVDYFGPQWAGNPPCSGADQ